MPDCVGIVDVAGWISEVQEAKVEEILTNSDPPASKMKSLLL